MEIDKRMERIIEALESGDAAMISNVQYSLCCGVFLSYLLNTGHDVMGVDGTYLNEAQIGDIAAEAFAMLGAKPEQLH